jgi:hypothetical protein
VACMGQRLSTEFSARPTTMSRMSPWLVHFDKTILGQRRRWLQRYVPDLVTDSKAPRCKIALRIMRPPLSFHVGTGHRSPVRHVSGVVIEDGKAEVRQGNRSVGPADHLITTPTSKRTGRAVCASSKLRWHGAEQSLKPGDTSYIGKTI